MTDNKPCFLSVKRPKLYALDPFYLEKSMELLEGSNSMVKQALIKLTLDADDALKKEPQTVTNKELIPPSGDKHDYFSISPYWWPNPDKPDGLPYIQQDGLVNPERKSNKTDSTRTQIFFSSINTLSIAYYFTKKRVYAERVALLIRTWFLDSTTKMNPNLYYSQAVPGLAEGRSSGIIDFRKIYQVIDALGLIEDTSIILESEYLELIEWLRMYNDWLLFSEFGQEEGNRENNHGIWYYVQIISIALFMGDLEKVKLFFDNVIIKKLENSVDKDGRQLNELKRTRPFHYSLFNLEAMMLLARFAEHVGIDLWSFSSNDNPIRKAFDFLIYYLDKPKEWPFKDLENFNSLKMLPIILQAERAYSSGSYSKYLNIIPFESLNFRERLLWPTL